jgi:hypothetical protein
MNRMSRRAIARILAATLLFAQAIVAFADCQMPTRSPAAAIAAKPAPCHESSGEKNLCVAHCLAADQSLDKPQVSPLAPALAPVLVLHEAMQVPQSWSRPQHRVTAAIGPPPRIRFQSLLL